MIRYLALLRGINNIGASKRVAMADLRALFARLGFRDVQTVLNSGNVVFTVDKGVRREVLARIECALASKLHVTAPLTLLSAREVETTVRENPLARVVTNPSNLLVVVPRARADLRRLQPLLAQRWAPEALAVGQRAAYVWCGNGIPRSPLWSAVDRAFARTGTARNLATFTRVLALLERPGSLERRGGPV